MKIAICLSGKFSGKNQRGEIQGFEIPFEFLYKNIIMSNDVDIFIHGWDDNPYQSKKLLETYKPKKHIIEKQIDFKHPFKDYKFIPNGKWSTQSNIKNNYSRFYSIKKSIDLVEGEYDFVFLTRFDTIFYTPFNFKTLNSDNFYVSNWNKNHLGYGFNDAWFFSSKENMVKYSEIYNRLNIYFKAGSEYFKFLESYGFGGKNMNSGHLLSRYHVNNIGINEIYSIGLEYKTWGLLRRLNQRSNPWWKSDIDITIPHKL